MLILRSLFTLLLEILWGMRFFIRDAAILGLLAAAITWAFNGPFAKVAIGVSIAILVLGFLVTSVPVVRRLHTIQTKRKSLEEFFDSIEQQLPKK